MPTEFVEPVTASNSPGEGIVNISIRKAGHPTQYLYDFMINGKKRPELLDIAQIQAAVRVSLELLRDGSNDPYRKMLAAKEACVAAGVPVPPEVSEYLSKADAIPKG